MEAATSSNWKKSADCDDFLVLLQKVVPKSLKFVSIPLLFLVYNKSHMCSKG